MDIDYALRRGVAKWGKCKNFQRGANGKKTEK